MLNQRKKMNVFLFGFKKCGKTYYGMKVAQKLHRDFLESNYLVEELYLSKYHKALSHQEIVQNHGFPFFQELETHAVSKLLEKRNCIVSLGGGVLLNSENISRLKQVGVLVYIETPKKTLKERILSSDIPPYLDPQHPGKSFDAFYEERVHLYQGIPAYTITTESKTEEEIIKDLSDTIARIG